MQFLGKLNWNIAKREGISRLQQVVPKLRTTNIKFFSENGSGKTSQADEYKTIKVEVSDGIQKITLNRPEKKNALNIEMYEEWINALERGTGDKNTVVTAITGAGDTFCGGNDLNMFMALKDDQSKKKFKEVVLRFLHTHIDYKKPLFAIVNGPALGIGTTILGLLDSTYASEKAFFYAPFTKLQQGPKACSTFTFPLLMGLQNASQILMLDQKLSAQEAYQRNLVTQIFPSETMHHDVGEILKKFAKLHSETLISSKMCIRKNFRNDLINAMEVEIRNFEDKMEKR